MVIGKIALKTAFSTVIVFLSVLLLSFNVVVLFFPSVAADTADRLGNKSLSISLSRVAADRSGDINEIALLIERSIKYGNFNIVAQYVPVIKGYAYYGDFADFKDKQLAESSDYRKYIDGNYLIALYSQKQYDKCISLCSLHMEGGYFFGNPVRFLVRHLSALQVSFEELTDLLKEKYESESVTAEEKKNICVDLYSIYFGINDIATSTYWQNEYKTNKGQY